VERRASVDAAGVYVSSVGGTSTFLPNGGGTPASARTFLGSGSWMEAWGNGGGGGGSVGGFGRRALGHGPPVAHSGRGRRSTDEAPTGGAQ